MNETEIKVLEILEKEDGRWLSIEGDRYKALIPIGKAEFVKNAIEEVASRISNTAAELDALKAELEETEHKWHWLCSCHYENNAPVCTHCGNTYAGNVEKLRTRLAAAQADVESARELIESDSEVRKDTGRDYSRHEAFLSSHPETKEEK